MCVISLELDATGKVSGAGFDDRVAAGREQFTLKGGVEPKASMISMSAFYSSFGPSSVGHYSYCLWADSVDDNIDGFFGIWEQASHDPHFELRRGGYCRCFPGDLTSMLRGSEHERERRIAENDAFLASIGIDPRGLLLRDRATPPARRPRRAPSSAS